MNVLRLKTFKKMTLILIKISYVLVKKCIVSAKEIKVILESLASFTVPHSVMSLLQTTYFSENNMFNREGVGLVNMGKFRNLFQ